MKQLQQIWNKISNTKSIISLASLFILLATTWGLEIPNEKIMVTVKVLCVLGTMTGILNNNGMDTPKWNL